MLKGRYKVPNLEDYSTFNAFGLVQVYRTKITVSAAMFLADGTSTEKFNTTYLEEPIYQVPEGLPVVFQFAAMVNAESIRVATLDLSARSVSGGPDLKKYKVIDKAINKILKEFR